MNRITNEKALQSVFVKGFCPAVQEEISKYKEGSQSFYDMALTIGEYVNTYHQIFCTGNIVNGDAKK